MSQFPKIALLTETATHVQRVNQFMGAKDIVDYSNVLLFIGIHESYNVSKYTKA